jgi:hypothetical protein
MHLSELETKMKQSSLEAQKYEATSSSSSLSDHPPMKPSFGNMPAHSFNDRGDSEFASFQREMRNSMMQRESFLDDYCDTIVDSQSAFSHTKTASTVAKIEKLELASAPSVVTDHLQTPTKNHSDHHGKSNGSIRNGKPITIDPKKKTNLLAALKHIDNDSFDR